jgi:hypothetical protein
MVAELPTTPLPPSQGVTLTGKSLPDLPEKAPNIVPTYSKLFRNITQIAKERSLLVCKL